MLVTLVDVVLTRLTVQYPEVAALPHLQNVTVCVVLLLMAAAEWRFGG